VAIRYDPTGPSLPTIKRLFAHSGNRCAFPQCMAALFEGTTVIGKICHIKAANPRGPRYDPQQSATERHGYDNLLLLCGKHHTVIDDDVETYTVECLVKMKTDHESRATRVDDDFAEMGARILFEQFVIDQTMTSIDQSGGIFARNINAGTINVHPHPKSTASLKCSFAVDISGCVIPNVIMSHFPPAPDELFIPPISTVAPSVPVGELKQENITLYSIKVEAIDENEISNCRGRLMTISRNARTWQIDTILPFAPFEMRNESIAKTIFPNVPEFLNVFFIAERNIVKLCSYLNPPNIEWLETIFRECGAYVFRIAVMAPKCDTKMIELLFNWTGNATTATVSRI
jgi:hypothetical protein